MVDDRARGVNLLGLRKSRTVRILIRVFLDFVRFIRFVPIFIAGADHLRDQLLALCIQHQHDSLVGFHVLKDQIHHYFKHLILIERAAE